MKILAIRGKNIASFEGEFAVDFQSEPLLSAGLFAITGPTGAGKSTLLDVLCLALFDKTPRMNRARENGVLLPDVLDKTLSQNDCRSLLRRGKSEGYAEADFLAVNGESYRSRWSVRRAHNRSEGSLQSSEIRLYNLHTGQEEQGGKSDLLQRITQLLGLSFEQFTRAVLLAQGDFAAFLKAPEEEKADLLEKLTGSEIYSQISKTIYTRHKELKEQYDALLERIKHIPLLTAEESAALLKERDSRQQSLQTIEPLLKKLMLQLQWIGEYHNLKNLLKEAENNRQTALQQWENAKARRENITQYDLAQEIRDPYNEWQGVLADKKKVTEQLAVCEKERCRQEEELARQEREKNEAEQQLQRLKQQWEDSAEERTRAQELDTQLAVIRESLSRIQKLYTENERIWAEEQVQKKKIDESLAEKGKNVELLSQWIQRQKEYEPIVTKAEVIQKDFFSWEQQRDELQKQQQLYQQLCQELSQAENEVSILQREEQRLETARPSEVYLLRATLVEGEPCPVCGSTHHFYTAEKVEALQYEELERQKKENADRLQEAKQQVEKINQMKGGSQTLIPSITRQVEDMEQNLNSLLGTFLPQWKRENRLGERIQHFAATWNQKKEELLRLETEIQTLRQGLPNLEKKLDQYEEAKNRSAAELQVEQEKQDRLVRERSQVLGGRSLNEIQERQEHQEKIAEAAKVQKEKEWAEESRRHTQNLGKGKQLQQQLSSLQQKDEEKEREINDWLLTHPTLTGQRLAELLAYTPTWITEEKERLNQLQKQVTTTENSYQERIENVRRHEAKEEKSDTLQPEELQQQSETLREQQKADQNRIAEINARLAEDIRHQEEIQQLKIQQEKLFQEKENWASLNELFGSADGFKFRRIAQGYTLDRLLIYANLHLKDLSPRYTLQRVADRLALQVCDNDMLGEIRSVHTLSGGETFLISLALALGLSSLSSYRMNIESLFIDEGFGSLDTETLTLAMDALGHLQIQGRKIGVISHVAEMTERIPVQIQVCRLANSRSQIKVTGA
ncbi:MAG: AAA family ATPase [Porphyromonadaceae bacterium]|nr:AAA family ATPase [Porphyromonadaceae bacterium]